MRILHLTDLYPPVLGGLETQLEQLCRELASRGHEVDVVTLAGTGGPKAEVREGVRVHRIAGVTRILRPLYEDPRRPFHPTVPDPLL
nr:glycosyltransferase [Candidatus Dormibacteraeota bacterium]